MNTDDKTDPDMAIQTDTRGVQRMSFPQKMSAIGARLSKALSIPEGGDNSSVAETLMDKGQDSPSDSEGRSVSRGRETFQSFGRGGIGNIRQSSLSRDSRPIDGPDDFSPTRGREPAVHPDRVISIGRGGAGNIRSPSRDPCVPSISEEAAESTYQAKLIREHDDATTIHSSGRGGVGNINASRSRSRDPGMVMHSTGRGGAGNIHPGGLPRDTSDEAERVSMQHAHHQAIHSTGRGGVANLTGTHEPDIERVHHHLGEFESSGRGGAGNIRDRSRSRDLDTRVDSKEKHGIAAIFDKITHPHHNEGPPY